MADSIDNPGREKDLIEISMERFKIAKEATAKLREEALEDLNFLIGDQWPDQTKQDRQQEQRPCLTMNMLPKFIRQVTGDARQNKPGIEVHPVDDDSDPETAKVFEGIIRNIEYVSTASVSYDTALDHAASCGFGYFRVNTQYADEDTFQQEIRIQRIPNPFSVYYDPNCIEPDRSDAKWCIVTEKLAKDAFEEQYPKAAVPVANVEGSTGDRDDWVGLDTVRIAEYWYKVPTERTLVQAQFPDGQTGVYFEEDLGKVGADGIPLLPHDTQILKTRKVKIEEVKRCLHTADEILEETDWPGRYIPIVPVLGEEINVDGVQHLRSVIRFAKDAQRAYNYHWSTATEMIALAPKSPWLVTTSMTSGFESEWDNAHRKTFGRLYWNPDPAAPGARPERQPFPQIPTASVEMLQLSSQGMKDTTGIYDASLGKQSNETSGRAIVARQREGDTGTFVWIDNLTKAITYLGKILVDLIPKIYDTPQVVRIRGKDNSTDFKQINGPALGSDGQPATNPHTGEMLPFYDLTVGKYDVVIQVGPSYTTKRIEQANDMLTLMEKLPPPQAALISDLVVSGMDFEGAKDAAARLKATLPPPIANATAQGPDGKPAPPQPPPPPPPDPRAIAAQEQTRINGMKAQFEMEVLRSQTILNLAKAEQAHVEGISQYVQDITAMMAQNQQGMTGSPAPAQPPAGGMSTSGPPQIPSSVLAAIQAANGGRPQ